MLGILAGALEMVGILAGALEIKGILAGAVEIQSGVLEMVGILAGIQSEAEAQLKGKIEGWRDVWNRGLGGTF